MANLHRDWSVIVKNRELRKEKYSIIQRISLKNMHNLSVKDRLDKNHSTAVEA